MVYKYDYLVIGSGIAGMSYALKVAATGKVALICKTNLEEANTYFAQGGVASVTNLEVDNFDKHIEDTMIAGDWLSDRAAVEKVVKGAPEQIRQLIEWGVKFDKNEKGEFDLHREGGHSEFRILHHADNTGAEIQDSLIRALQEHPNIDVFENHFAVEIITQHHLGKIVTRRTPDIECYGAYILNPETHKVDTYLSKVTLMLSSPMAVAAESRAYNTKSTLAILFLIIFVFVILLITRILFFHYKPQSSMLTIVAYPVWQARSKVYAFLPWRKESHHLSLAIVYSQIAGLGVWQLSIVVIAYDHALCFHLHDTFSQGLIICKTH